MKHYFIPMMLMAVAAFASCEKSNLNEQKAQEGSYVYTISAVAPDMTDDSVVAQAPTRTDYTDAGVFSWSAGDAISVLFHNNNVNKFFTLTTTESGASVKFSGSIEAGYEIGASDGDANDKKIWALFPASENHVYTAGSNPTFHLSAETDYTASHFSANLPMYEVLTEEGTMSFKNLCSAYKFIVSDLDVSKISFTVSNQITYALSGNIAIAEDSGGYYLNQGWSASGSSERSQTYISDVNAKTATFYVPCRHYAAAFQPIITIKDYNTGFTIKTLTATKATAISDKGSVKPITISAPGTGSALVSAYGINWGSVTCEAVGSTGDGVDAIRKIKATADDTYLYVYLEVLNERLYSNDSYTYSNRSYLYVGDGSAGTSSNWTQDSQTKVEGWLKYNGVPCYINWANVIDNNRANGTIAGDIAYFEMAIQRSAVPCLQSASASTAYVGFMVTDTYNTGSTYGSRAENGYAPAKGGSMLEVAVPAYVAP